MPAVQTPRLVRTYFVNGTQPKGSKYRFAIDNPPAVGHSHIIVLAGEKRSTLLCPFTLQSYQVPNSCGELDLAKDVEITAERLAGLVSDSWTSAVQMGLQRDFAVAAMVLTQLGAEVPVDIEASPSTFRRQATETSDEPKVQGGKPIDMAVLKPIRPTSKRAEVARFFMGSKPQSLHEAMARLGLTRSGVLSHLYCINRDHGLGYSLVSDCASLLLPPGFDPFAWVEPEKKAPVVKLDEDGQPHEPKKRTSGKAINVEALAPIPEPGKRAGVAKFFLDWCDVKKVEQLLELNRSAVLSHLFTINKENGLGYELSEDGTQARLLIPEGHVVFCAKQPRAKKEVAA